MLTFSTIAELFSTIVQLQAQRNIVGLNQSLQGMVTGSLRIGLGMYGLDLGRSMQETLSDIYYRIYYLLCNNVRHASITGKSRVQVNANTTVTHFGGVVGCVRESGLTKQIIY